MVKTQHTPPRFLQGKLDSKKLAFVKKHIPSFLEKIKKKLNGELPPNTELLCQYINYLGKIDSAFKGIHNSCIVTTYEGIYQIYDPLRRGAGRHIEEKEPIKPASPGRVTRAKAEANPLSKEPKQIEDQDAVKIQANHDWVNGDMAEKEVPYRQEPREESSIQPNATTIQNDEVDPYEDVQKDIGGPWWQKEKKLFANILDSFDPTEFRELTFKVLRNEQGICQIIIENMRAQH